MDAGVAGLSFPLRPALAGSVALVLLSAFAYRDLFGGGMILTGDTLQAMRVFEMHRCLDDGQIPCRWVPDLGHGYGLPLFNYYPPLPYYIGDLLHRLGLSYLRAVDALYVLGLVGAGLSMFVLARRLWGDLGGLVSAVAYVYAPYLAIDVYMRGALAELWGLALAPALLWAIYELVTTGRVRFVPVVALFTALLLLSHNPVVVIMAPAVVLWATVLLFTRGREARRPALLGAAGALWGLGLAAFFTVPVLTEGDLVQLDSLTRGPFHYSNNFVSVNDLFLLRTADYSFLLGGRDATPIQIGWFHWAAVGLSLPAALLFLRTGRRTPALAVLMFAVFFGIGVFMTVSRSRFIWDAFGSLRFLQFPWRYLGLVGLAAAGLAGAWLGLLRNRPLSVQLLVAALLIGVFIGSGHVFFEPVHRCHVSDSEVFSGQRLAEAGPDVICDQLIADPQRGSIRDYLPNAVAVIPEPPEVPAQVVDGSARVLSASAGTDWLRLRVEAAAPAQIEAALFDYPNWRVEIDGREVPHTASIPNGLVTFRVPAGDHQVEARLEDTTVRRLGNWLSLVSWAALVLAVPGMLLAQKLREWRKSLQRRAEPIP